MRPQAGCDRGHSSCVEHPEGGRRHPRGGGRDLFSEAFGVRGNSAREKGAVLALFDVGNLGGDKKDNSISLDGEGGIKFPRRSRRLRQARLPASRGITIRSRACRSSDSYRGEENPDQPGRLVQWMHTRTPCYTWKVRGSGTTSVEEDAGGSEPDFREATGRRIDSGPAKVDRRSVCCRVLLTRRFGDLRLV